MSNHSILKEAIGDRWVTSDCKTSKRAYQTRSDGKTAARLMAKRGQGNLRPYTCRTCGNWHIGHTNKVPQFIQLSELTPIYSM